MKGLVVKMLLRLHALASARPSEATTVPCHKF